MKIRRWSLCIVCLLGLLLGGVQPVFPALAAQPANTTAAAALPASLLHPDGSLNLSDGFSGSLDLRGWQVKLDVQRGPILAPTAASPGWNLLGTWTGTTGDQVYALTVYGSDVYVGGEFHSAGGVTYADHIAKWNPTTGWSAIGRGTYEMANYPGTVRAIVVNSSYVYAAGDFLFALNSDGNWAGGAYVARWNGSYWSSLGTGCCDIGTSGPVYALALSGNSLYLGGNFSGVQNGFLPSPYILRWDTSASNWNKVGQGMNGPVYTLAASGSDLYVGGAFTQATNTDNSTVTANRVVRWNGTTWNEVGKGANGTVHRLPPSSQVGHTVSTPGRQMYWVMSANPARW